MSELKQGTTQFTLEGGKRILSLINNSYTDYLSARILYNNGMLIPATILSNTAIEKFLKAYLEVMGDKIKIKHDPLKLFQILKKRSAGIANQLNEEYFKSITKIYQSRYLENMSPGYNFVIIKRKYLAELDYCFSVFEPLITFKNARPGPIGRMRYQDDVHNSDPRLLTNNYKLNGINKKSFIETTDFVWEFRVTIAHEFIDVHYLTEHSKDDGHFLYKGLLPKGEDNKSFDLSHYPLNQ